MTQTDTNTTNNPTSQNANSLPAEVTANIHNKLAKELGIKPAQVNAFVKLYDEGATVPFIARYRKEKTQGLDDSQLRALEKGLSYERDMASRRAKILELLSNQGNLTEALQARIEQAKSKLELEDIYLPYRPRRRSLAAKARAAGLDKVAEQILTQDVAPLDALQSFSLPEQITDDTGAEIDVDFSDTDKQLAGVEAIIIDDWTQQLELLDELRNGFAKTATINSSLANEEKREVGEKFTDYFDHSENLARLPNHRLLAMLRGRQENVLVLKVDGEDAPFIEKIISKLELDAKQPDARREFLVEAANSLWKDKWRPHLEHRLLTEKRLAAEADAIDVFASNLQHLLMAAPAGRKVILGVDPGIRHGVKMAVIDSQGHVIHDAEGNPATATVYPFAPDNKMDEAKATIAELLKTHQVELVAIGNGTASRETDAMIKELIDADKDITAKAVVVNESGASVYSASELASDELADLDVSIRGAVSIARRLQDPLSELVKVEPKAIGVGQYQHDVNQTQLSDSLDKVTQDCVNAVGVDVNTASPAILAHIAGLNRNVAQQIVNYRKEHGAFTNREQLKDVPRLGVKTFEQAAGFLRIRDGEEPLDATGVHPESYDLVKQILQKSGKDISEVLGNDSVINTLAVDGIEAANDDNISIAAIKQELAKPAHDPRPEFKTAQFRDDVNSVSDLEEGMQLEGVVTNVTGFGCFVDVGVHQDGLVHISEMANDFVEDPMNLVKPGDIVNVRVISIDEKRGRIGFSMKSEQEASSKRAAAPADKAADKPQGSRKNTRSKPKADAKKGARPNSGKPAGKSNTAKPKADDNKIGSLGALLKEAGLKKAR
ncbi:Tex family protein [Psychrobacter sp. FDAARGOS_221]|uniref:Tex family protein n=1 Tax=Psychrobacter sp. FDAARGOS_221 TaxID=1975705 RepID=UPI000BB5869B|nr:Tex family protein [Psychrobacter sp. FDAARGOS_221]PNK61037.1 RNA-binding transcriptional accessory protein [Psychrobacter sp. FDAARGOS_221]